MPPDPFGRASDTVWENQFSRKKQIPPDPFGRASGALLVRGAAKNCCLRTMIFLPGS